MKLTHTLLALSLLLTACEDKTDDSSLSDACPEYSGWDVAETLTNVTGTVVNEADTSKTSTWLYIRTADSKRYFACNLPATYRKTGTNVVFDATQFLPPPNVRLAGIPIKLTRIQPAK